jgi:tRNA (guanine-N7-)-methyltransferase
MGQKKLARFAELDTLPNVLQFPSGMAGQWNSFFRNEKPITLELACGKGEYAVGLAELYPDRNFIGVDIKGNRIWVGAKRALTEGLPNVSFLRVQIDQLADYFGPGEVKEIWITFPDPQLRFSKAKKRLTHPKFLRIYQQFLCTGGLVHLKTDSPSLYKFTKTVIAHYGCKLIQDLSDVFDGRPVIADLKIKTHYEALDISGSAKIHYLCFSLPANLGNKESDDSFKEKLKADEGVG